MSCHRTVIRLSAVLAVLALANGCGGGESPTAPPTPEPARARGTVQITVLNPVASPDREILVALYNATDGPNWIDSDT